MQEIAAQAARQAMAMYLENETQLHEHAGEMEEATMPRIKQRVNVNGVQCWLTGDTQQEILDKYAQMKNCAANPTDREVPLFSDYCTQWYTLYKELNLTPKTCSTYKSLINHHIIPEFGDMRLTEISTAVLQRFYNRFDIESTSHQLHVMLSQILDSAVEDGYIAANPAKSKRIALSKKKGERLSLPVEQIMDIAANMDKLREKDRLMLGLMIYTGMRRGEVLALQWRNVNLDRRLIHVKASVTFATNKGHLGAPKSKSGYRDIPIPDNLYTLLCAVSAKNPDDFVIGGEAHYTESRYDRAWQRISKTIDLHGATAHVLRHSYLTILGTTETSVKTIQAIAGHADIQTTMNRYVHRDTAAIEQAGLTINNIFCRSDVT